jgi:hypothetical protein
MKWVLFGAAIPLFTVCAWGIVVLLRNAATPLKGRDVPLWKPDDDDGLREADETFKRERGTC